MVNLHLGDDTNELITADLVKKTCELAMKAHKSQDKQYRFDKASSFEVVFSFPGSWSVDDWMISGYLSVQEEIIQLFPSLKYVGLEEFATIHEAFLLRFKGVLANKKFREEVEKAVKDGKKVVFTGHSFGGAIAILATTWFLELYVRQGASRERPLCVTFGAPLVGDRIMTHALRRENWSRYFINFIMRYDIVPRISSVPVSSGELKQRLQKILEFFRSPTREFPDVTPGFFQTVMRNSSAVASYDACKIMGSTNLLLETVTNFVELSPYRPCGTFVFCTGNGEFVVKDPNAVLQVLFYSLQLNCTDSQLNCTDSVLAVAQRSLVDHLNYENELRECVKMLRMTYLDHLDMLPLSSNEDNLESAPINKALNDLGLSTRARICLRATEELEKQKIMNMKKIDQKKDDRDRGIKKIIEKLEGYKTRCTFRKLGYYDAFRISKEEDDFHANVARLELAGIWDEIIEMLKRHELPDEFETRKEWIELGTRYRRLVEPLDIANYYRHLKNEDTGSYMGHGRPKRYKCTQRWREHALGKTHESPDSCLWAEVEDLRTNPWIAGDKEKVRKLVYKVQKWVKDGELKDEDIRLEGSTFMKLLAEHNLTNIY